jgi:hypothetical protein
MAKKKKTPASLPVFILTGGTGRTGQQVLKAALAQFDRPGVQQILRKEIRTVEAVRQAVQEAVDADGVICHSVVEPGIREAVVEETKRHGIPAVDVLGPVLRLLDDHLKQSPRRQPGLSYQLQQEHFDRIDAVDFTLEHDDGVGLNDLDRADVIIIGVSRVSKSVTCFYLSYQGVRAANVPLVPGHEPPKELLEIDPDKVIGLTMNINRLQSVREARIEMMGRGPFEEYGDKRAVGKEIRFANELMEQHGWRGVDVSYKSTEEVAKEVLALLEQ